MGTPNSFDEHVAIELMGKIISKVEDLNSVLYHSHGDTLSSRIIRLAEMREKVETASKNKFNLEIISKLQVFIKLSTEIYLEIDNLGTSKTEALELSRTISELSNQLQETHDILTHSENITSPDNLDLETSSLKKTLSNLKTQQLKQNSRIEEWIRETAERLSTLSVQADKINTNLQEELSKAQTHHDSVTAEINKKNKEINEILGVASSNVLSGDHGNNASAEEKTANILRILSVGCMLIILAILGFTVWESTKSNFSWDTSLFRVSIAFFLSVPAAYLARESAKHREQQYHYRQTALNLKALSPYIASLPDNDQHKLKIDIASKIFAGREPSKFKGDSYPINIQEIIIALISKIEIPTKNTKPDEKSD